MKYLIQLSVSGALIILASCGVPKNFQHANYFQDSITEAEKVVMNMPILIEPGDRLNIDITATNKEAATAFTAPASGTLPGYVVDSLGNINLVQLGSIKVQGLTVSQLKARLEEMLADYVKGPVVSVSILNFRVNMMGEVGTPGSLAVPEGKITILQAISQSGDLTLYGNRENILVIREANGKREFGRVNVNSNRVFESPYYYLKQNDIVYVEADKTKYISNDVILARNLRNLGIFTTVLSTILLVLNLVNN